MSDLVSITCSGDGTVRNFWFDASGITPAGASEVGKGVSAMALVPGRDEGVAPRAFVAVKEGPAIVALELERDAAGGQAVWRELGRTAIECHQSALAVSPDGRFLLGASYAQGLGQVWPIDGARLGQPSARIEFANLHCVIAVDHHVYFVSLGDDLLAGYTMTDEGALEPLGDATTAAPDGSGPRHVVASGDGRNLYVITEFSGELIRYERDRATGVLAQRERVAAHDTRQGLGHSVFGADPLEHHYVWGADVHWVGETWLLASERTASTLSVHPVGPTGELGQQVCIVTTETQPRGFITHGDLVVCPGEKSDQVSLFRLDDDGQLHLVGRAPSGTGGNWARVVG